MKSKLQRALVVLLALVMVSTALVAVGSGSARAAVVRSGPTVTTVSPGVTNLPSSDSEFDGFLSHVQGTPAYWDKMSASVQEAAASGSGTMNVAIYTTEVANLGALLRRGGVDTPIGTVPSASSSLRGVIVDVPAKLLEKIASLDSVVAVAPAVLPQVPDQADPDLPARTTPGNAPSPMTIESGKGHHVPEAWALGFTGSGVQVAVMDSGVDFGHPDLQGTEARVSDISSPYYNWPIAFDPSSMAQYLLAGLTFPTSPGSWYVDTSFVSSADVSGNLSLFNGHTYNVNGVPSASGIYHLGIHPDLVLTSYWFGESPGVLVTDSVTPGVYDTVYVDLNDDYSFGNDKPVNVGSPEAWADFYNAAADTYDFSTWNGGDGIADASGGMVYFIADGLNVIPYSDVISDRYGLPLPTPSSGDLVAFMLGDALAPGGDHGTLCASSIVAQNVTGHVHGFAPDAKLIAVGDSYAGGFGLDIYNFVAEGYDGIAGTGDEAQIASASFGYSSINNDGWDYEARYVELNTLIYPDTGFSVSTGNGGHGFGTITSPGSSNGVISVGASTSYNKELGVEGFEDANHSTFGDVQPWSNRGPSALGMSKPDVVTVGAWATGDGATNSFFFAPPWTVWGGTSLSAPATAGIVALIAQAWYGTFGSWSNFAFFGKMILVDTADNIHYDPQVMGHGISNAYRAVRAASLQDGVIVTDQDYTMYPGLDWAAGDYRGTKYPSFTHIMSPGQVYSTPLEVDNANTTDNKDVTISDWELDKIGSDTFFVNTTNALESAPDFLRPDYLMDLTPYVPVGTNLVKVTVTVPYSQFDPDNDYDRESSWRLVLYDWADYNGNDMYWNDTNGNGVVNAGEMDNSAGTEVMRFTYGYPTGTNIEAFVHDPLDRIHDGLLLGIQHRFVSSQVPFSNLTVTVDYYAMTDAPWLSEDITFATIGPFGSIYPTLTVTLPADQPYGTLSGMVTITDDEGQETQFPVIVNVAATGTDFSFGNDPNSTAFLDNNRVFGGIDWTWRAEAGDWRFFFTDIPDSTPINPGDSLLVHTWWENVPTDLDTIIMGPTGDDFSSMASFVWGPYTLGTVGQSVNTLISAGAWRFQTATGRAEEWVSAPLQTGLHEIALHNVNFAGVSPSEVFGGQAGVFSLAPNPWQVSTPDLAGTSAFTASSSLDLPGLDVLAFGLGQPEVEYGNYIDPSGPWTTTFNATHIGMLQIGIQESYYQGMDLDLYLYRWTGTGYALVASSAGSTATEGIRLTMPQDGEYLVLVDPFSVPAGYGYFDYMQIVVAGTQLTPSDVPTTAIPAGTPATFNVSWSVPDGTQQGWYYGVLFVGPTGAPAVEVDAQFYFYDAYAPEILTTTPPDGGYANGEVPNILVTYRDPVITSGINHVEFYFDGLNLPGFGDWNETAFVWQFPFDWADGTHWALVYVYDNVGFSVGYYWTFTVDTAAPSLVVTSPTVTLTNVATVDVIGTTDVDATVTVNGVAATVDPGTGAFVATVDLVEGTNTITTVATDPAGNFAQDIRAVMLDTVPPELTVDTPSDGDLLNVNLVHVSGTAEVGATLAVNGVTVAVDSLGDWAVDLASADGTHTIAAVATDAAGNTASASVSVTVDTLAPALSVSAPAYALTNLATATVVGTTEAGAAVTVNGATATVGAGGAFSASVTLAEGPNTITVVATDAAGNGATVTKFVTLDTTAPVVTVTAPTDGLSTNHATVIVTGTVDDDTATVLVNGIQVHPNAQGAWSVSVALAEGSNTVSVSAVDPAGNQAAATSRTVTYNSPVPGLQNGIDNNTNGVNANKDSINGLSSNLMLGLIVVLLVALAAIGAVYFLLNRKISGGGKKPEQP
jgi:hypothetical protein